jgi:hypothetical protein
MFFVGILGDFLPNMFWEIFKLKSGLLGDFFNLGWQPWF